MELTSVVAFLCFYKTVIGCFFLQKPPRNVMKHLQLQHVILTTPATLSNPARFGVWKHYLRPGSNKHKYLRYLSLWAYVWFSQHDKERWPFFECFVCSFLPDRLKLSSPHTLHWTPIYFMRFSKVLAMPLNFNCYATLNRPLITTLIKHY